MVQVSLTKEELFILTKLLKDAEDEFSNHGCNDFDVGAALAIPRHQAIEVAHRMHEKMIDLGVDEEGRPASPSLFDCNLYAYFRVLFQKALGQAVVKGQNVPGESAKE